MRRWTATAVLAGLICGCGGDDDDVAEVKTALPMDQVPAVVLQAAKAAAPGLTFYAAYRGKYNGQESIELKGKSKIGKITELEISPDGKVLGTE
ncbi:MAG: hypothetical protein JWN86_2658 [Planctomycetota bacterium]|nr:hypothetical protein [Planctomycetota bacterium]